ncbi:MAG: response regulator [Anaerolineae bacterium]|nr:response regulator [Anaerolineae bacterium]
MTSILIVDDMPIIRSALTRIISQQDGGIFSPVLEAANGEEAVALARTHKPDIILMDIKMPGLTGLQATSIIQQEQPDVKIVILTAYNEFSYAQKALKLGARDYILKPVRPQKILQLLAEIRQEIQEEQRDMRTVEIVKGSLQKTMPVIETNLVENLVRGINPEGSTVDESLAYLGKRLVWPAVFVTKIDNFDQLIQEHTPATSQQIYTKLTQLIRSQLPDPHRALVGYSNPGRVVAIVSTEQSMATPTQIRAFCDQLRQTIAEQLPFTVTIGIGKRYMGYESIPLSYAEANLARRYHSRLQGNKVVDLSDIQAEQPQGDNSSHYLVQKEHELMQVVETNRKQEAQQLINEIVDYLSQHYYTEPDAMRNHCAELVTLVAWGVIGSGTGEQEVLRLLHQQVRALSSWKTGSDIRAWTLNSLAEMMTLVQDSSQQQDSVQIAIQYIQENYHRSDISLQEVADEVNLSQSHLSSQFKARTGTSYVKYLTALRMDNAMKLLQTTDQSVSTVAEMVGYPNTTNFYRHFQKYTKMTPAIYRQKMAN